MIKDWRRSVPPMKSGNQPVLSAFVISEKPQCSNSNATVQDSPFDS